MPQNRPRCSPACPLSRSPHAFAATQRSRPAMWSLTYFSAFCHEFPVFHGLYAQLRRASGGSGSPSQRTPRLGSRALITRTPPMKTAEEDGEKNAVRFGHDISSSEPEVQEGVIGAVHQIGGAQQQPCQDQYRRPGYGPCGHSACGRPPPPSGVAGQGRRCRGPADSWPA